MQHLHCNIYIFLVSDFTKFTFCSTVMLNALWKALSSSGHRIIGNVEMIEDQFCKNVDGQIALLNAGKPLEAFDKYFATNGVMYANGEIFARDAAEGRRKQESYITSAITISGKIDGLSLSKANSICAFRNLTSFVASGGRNHQINGMCWQRWQHNKIVEERYFDGEMMEKMLSMGILTSPEILI